MDTAIPPGILNKWLEWKKDVHNLNDFEINGCVRPRHFDNVVRRELHYFADASSLTGYGTCSYLRQFSDAGDIYVSLVMGKSRVVPLKKITVSRLELTAAVVAINISKFLTKQLKLESVESCYWTDSKVAVGYIANTVKRFHVFVANRIEQIRSFSTPSQWRHKGGKTNSADIASRGISAAKLIQSELWFNGPGWKNLWKNEALPEANEPFSLELDDPEVKKSTVLATHSALAGLDVA